MIGVGITGAAECRYVAGKLRKAAARDLTRELRRGLREAAAPLQPEIKSEAAATLPSGYGSVMAKAVKVTTRVRFGGSPQLTIRVYARGRKEERDVRAVNAGTLRHPLYGNRRHWYATRVRPGFVDRPIDRLGEEVSDRALDALDRIAAEIVS